MLHKNVTDGYVVPVADKHGIRGVKKPRPGETMVAVCPAGWVLFWDADNAGTEWRNFRLYRTLAGGGVINLASNGHRMADTSEWRSLRHKDPETAKWVWPEIFSWMKLFA